MLDLLIFTWELIGIITGLFILITMIIAIIVVMFIPLINKIEEDMNK